ncbi:hypothetical protein, partial [Treponema socranskii]|uniref:hypothetical protein n=1 Tax=Treponema socranskii TaxID=53419 RepID=UPI003D914671
FEQCGEIARVFYERKTRQTFFNSRLSKINPSSGRSRYIRIPLTTVFLLRKNTRPFRKDTTRHPCRALKDVPRAGFFRVSYHTARRKRRTVCPHKKLQSAFIPFITSERMKYKSLRTDKRKTAWPSRKSSFTQKVGCRAF